MIALPASLILLAVLVWTTRRTRGHVPVPFTPTSTDRAVAHARRLGAHRAAQCPSNAAFEYALAELAAQRILRTERVAQRFDARCSATVQPKIQPRLPGSQTSSRGAPFIPPTGSLAPRAARGSGNAATFPYEHPVGVRARAGEPRARSNSPEPPPPAAMQAVNMFSRHLPL